jgi:hypothetical protein
MKIEILLVIFITDKSTMGFSLHRIIRVNFIGNVYVNEYQ